MNSTIPPSERSIFTHHSHQLLQLQFFQTRVYCQCSDCILPRLWLSSFFWNTRHIRLSESLQFLIIFLHALRWRMQCFLIIYSGFTDSPWSIHRHRACNQHSLPVQPLYITSIYRSFGAHYSIFNYRFIFNYCCTGGSIFDAFASLRLMKNSIAFSLIWLDQSDDESASEKQCCQCSVHWISSDTSSTKNTAEFCVSFPWRIRSLHLIAEFSYLSYPSCNSFNHECIASAAIIYYRDFGSLLLLFH